MNRFNKIIFNLLNDESKSNYILKKFNGNKITDEDLKKLILSINDMKVIEELILNLYNNKLIDNDIIIDIILSLNIDYDDKINILLKFDDADNMIDNLIKIVRDEKFIEKIIIRLGGKLKKEKIVDIAYFRIESDVIMSNILNIIGLNESTEMLFNKMSDEECIKKVLINNNNFIDDFPLVKLVITKLNNIDYKREVLEEHNFTSMYYDKDDKEDIINMVLKTNPDNLEKLDYNNVEQYIFALDNPWNYISLVTYPDDTLLSVVFRFEQMVANIGCKVNCGAEFENVKIGSFNFRFDKDGKFLLFDTLKDIIEYVDIHHKFDNNGLNNGHITDFEKIIDYEKAAKEFSEGNKDLEELLKNCFSKGIETIACCAGHYDRNSYPYISFKYSEQILSLLMIILNNKSYSFYYFKMYDIENNNKPISRIVISDPNHINTSNMFKDINKWIISLDKNKNYDWNISSDVNQYVSFIKSIENNPKILYFSGVYTFEFSYDNKEDMVYIISNDKKYLEYGYLCGLSEYNLLEQNGNILEITDKDNVSDNLKYFNFFLGNSDLSDYINTNPVEFYYDDIKNVNILKVYEDDNLISVIYRLLKCKDIDVISIFDDIEISNNFNTVQECLHDYLYRKNILPETTKKQVR